MEIRVSIELFDLDEGQLALAEIAEVHASAKSDDPDAWLVALGRRAGELADDAVARVSRQIMDARDAVAAITGDEPGS